MRSVFANIVFATASIGITVCAVAASAPAAAANVAPTQSMVVRTGDLDLSSASGKTIAIKRINAAAWRVCEASASDHVDIAACREEAISNAVHALDLRITPEIASR